MLRIATYNANSIRSRLPIVVEWIERNAPDVLCVQETKVQDEAFPAEVFREIGYWVACHGQKSYNGVALISREEPQDVRRGLEDASAPGGTVEEARIIRARVRGVEIINTYVPQGTSVESPRYHYKLAWLRRLRGLLEREYIPQSAIVWVGDINVAPEPADVYDPAGLEGSVCFSAPEREALEEVVRWGFVDVFRKHHPVGGEFTFWDYFRGSFGRNRGWRIDHIYATEPLAGRSTVAWVDRETRGAEKPSDHAVVAADFDL